MRPVFYTVAAVLLGLLMLGGVLWYFAYGMSEPPPAEAAVPGLEREARIGWYDSGLTSIRAADDADAYTALGYAHGHHNAWTITLWKQTAEGRLAEWFGDDLLPVDRLTHRLGLSALARGAYEQLPETDRKLLRHYVRGVNAALAEPAVRRQEPFALLDLTPTRWEPWHPLALERLLAWLSTPSIDDTTGTATVAFRTSDRLLRRWLHLYGFSHSIAWAARDEASTSLFRRLVYGDAAPAVLQEVALHRPDSSVVVGATLPGAPIFLTARADDRAWVLLPMSTTSVVRLPRSQFGRPRTLERLRNPRGDESLVRVYRQDATIPLEELKPLLVDTTAIDTAAAPIDSVWALRWSGLQPTTDWPAWRALIEGQNATFELQRGDGLHVDGAGWRVTGSPRVAASFADGLVVSNSPWTPYVARRLDTLALRADSTIDMQAWRNDCVSTWAADVAPELVAAVDSLGPPGSATLFDDALVYLRNWDFAYDRASIGASIFETWVRHYHRATDEIPAAPSPADTTRPDARRHVGLLRNAVDSLAAHHGEDLSQWRWERVHNVNLAFPVWSADSLIDARPVPARSRYAPIERPGRGHPSAPCGGTSPSLTDAAAPAFWEGWSSTRGEPHLYVQPRRFDIDRFLDRYRIPSRPRPATRMAATAPPDAETVLRPAPAP